MKNTPIIFLGVCEKFSEPKIGIAVNSKHQQFDIARQDIIGLKTYHTTNFFPIPLNNLFVVFGLDQEYLIEASETPTKIKVLCEDPNKDIFGSFNVSSVALNSVGIYDRKFILGSVEFPGIICIPGDYSFYWLNGEEKVYLGMLHVYYSPLPLTNERIQAIKSDPLAGKSLLLELGCKYCPAKLRVTAGLEKKTDKDTIWYQDLPDEFTCDCGKTKLNITYLRESATALLGYRTNSFSYPDAEHVGRMYTHKVLEEMVRKFYELIERSDVNEEKVQKFIEENNGFLLSLFSPKLIKFKAPIGASYKTDFSIQNQKNELLLIEIEDPNMPLFTKKGEQSSRLTHAWGQVEDWLEKAKRNRLGLIDEIGIAGLSIENVTNIRGIVIAGRRKGNEEYIRKILDRNIHFYTYDDILDHVRTTIEEIKSL